MEPALRCRLFRMQGPFPREDILGWFNDNYFDERLRIRPENSPGSFRELSVMLKAWDWAKLQNTPPSSEQVCPPAFNLEVHRCALQASQHSQY